MVHTVQNKSSIFLASLSRGDILFPLVECFRNDVKIGILEEQADYRFLHVSSLLLRLFSQVVVDLLW
jgi:hypothetical protein